MRRGDGVRRGGTPEIECEERNGGGEGGYARVGTKTGGAEIPVDVTSVSLLRPAERPDVRFSRALVDRTGESGV